MYSKLKQCVAASCALLLASTFVIEAKAAVASDDKTETATSAEGLNPGTIDLDVPAYLVRYLYREPDADSLQMKKWYRGWGMMLYWNPDFLPLANSYNFPKGMNAGMSKVGIGFALSKDINKYSAIRVGINYSSVDTDLGKNGEENTLKRFNVSLDYLWNLSNTYYGYDLNRTDEWLLTMGVKAGRLISGYQKSEGSHSDYIGSVNMGLQYRKNIANDMSFFIEPQFAFFSDKYDGQTSYYEVDPGLNLLVGLYFRMGQPKMRILESENEILKNLFFQAYGGQAMSKDPYAFKTLSQDDYTRQHMNFGFNLGTWLNPSLAVRLGYFENIVGIGSSQYRIDHGFAPTTRQTYRGGRVEFVLNPLMIMTNRTSLGRFGWDISVGYEAGVLNKHKENYNNVRTVSGVNGNHVDYFASGVTFGTQLKYYMSKNYAFFLDGRYSNPMYSAEAKDGLTSSGDLSESILSWAVGMEYYISTFNRYSRFPKGDHHESREIERLENDNRWYVEIAGGIGEPTHWGENFKARRAMLGDVALGVNYNDYHGLRMRASLTRKYFREAYMPGVTNLIPGDTYTVGLGLDYMLNVTNLWWGVDGNETRWSDIYLFAGPTIRIATHDLRKSFTSRNVFGLEAGAQFTRRVSRSVELFLEPRYEYNIHESNDRIKPYMAGNRWDLMAGVKMYQWREKNYHYRDSIAGHDRRSWFMEVSAGAGFDVTGNSATLQKRVQELDGDLRLGFGYRINPISTMRFNAAYTQFGWGFGKNYSGNVNGKKGFEFSLDYMANLLNLWYGNNPHRLFQLQGYVGPVINPEETLDHYCTEDIAYTWRFGVEFGGQLIIAPFNNVSFFVEPRASYYVSDYITKRGSEMTKGKRDEHFDVYAGVIFYNQPEHLQYRGYKETDVDSARFWYYEMAGGASLTPSGTTGGVMNSFAPTAYLGLGHYLNNYSSIRFRLSLANSTHSSKMGYKDKFATGGYIDYMYNLTNRMMGVNPYRRFDFSVFAGPGMEFRNSENHDDDRWLLAFDLGGQLSWHMNNYLDIFAEGRAVMPAKRMNADDDHMYRIGHTRYEALAGVKLYQNKSKTIQYRDSLSQHANTWFIEVAGGAGKTLKVGQNTEMDDQKHLDGTGKLAVGYRFNPISTLRLSAMGWANNKRYIHGAMSFDYMADLLNLWYGNNPYRRFNLRGFVGPVLRFDNIVETAENMDLNLAFNAGVQFTVGITDNIDFLLEPRYEGMITGDDKNTGRGDVYAGVIFYNRPGLLSARNYPTVYTDKERAWYLETAAGISFSPDGRQSGITTHFDPMLNLAIGRYLSNYSSVRLRGSMGYARDKKTNKESREWIPEVSLDYMHNMTNHLLGVNPYRRWDFSLFAGPMAQIAGLNTGNLNPHWGITGGSDVSWHVNNFVDVFVEPRLSYLFNDDYYSRFEALGGLRLYRNHTNNMQYMGSDAAHANTWFLETAGGAGAVATDVLSGQNIDFTLKGAFGYRFNPISSVRFGGAAWTHKLDDGGYARSAEVFVDYMANIQNILYGVNPYRKFNLRGFVGGVVSPEAFLAAANTTWLVGFDLGLQGTYALTNNIDLMIEPRLESYLNSGATQRLDVYAGLIWYNQRGLLPNKGYNPTGIEDKNTWFIEGAGGFSFAPDGRTDGAVLSHIDIDAIVGLGIHFDNYSSLRGRGNLAFIRNARTTKDRASYHPFVSLNYMYNITNGLMGVNPYRRFDVNLFAGPLARIYGLRSGIDFKQTMKLGVEAGAQASWHVNNKWDIFGEGGIIIGNKFSTRLFANAGVSYRFNKLSLQEASGENLSEKLYAQVLLGGQMVNVEGRSTINSFQSLPTINYNVGYRLNKMLNVQAGVYSNHLSAQGSKGKDAKDAYTYGFRGEVVANIINLFNPSYDAYEKRFQWTGSVGAQFGRTRNEDLTRSHARFSATAATQAQYRVFNHSWALLELRAQTLDANSNVSIPLTAQLGMMYDFNSGDNNPLRASKWYVQGGIGMFESNAGGFEVGAGYDITPVHGLRVLYDASFDDIDKLGGWKSLSPDYVLNLSNLLFGHDDSKRHVDLSVLVGADLNFLEVNGESKNSFGANAGLQLTYNINQNWSIYTEPRFSYCGTDETKHNNLELQTTVGLKYRLPSLKKE